METNPTPTPHVPVCQHGVPVRSDCAECAREDAWLEELWAANPQWAEDDV